VENGLRRAPYPLQLPKEPIGASSNALEQFTSKEGLSSDFATIIAEDREGNIWVATRDGLDQFRNSALAPVIPGPTATQLSIAADNDGYVAALDNSGHLFRFHDAQNKTTDTKDLGVTLLYRDPFGSIWGTGRGGACRFVGAECASHLDLPGEYRPSYGSRLLAVDGNHRLWCFVPDLGLFAFENERWIRYSSAPPALASAESTTQYTDAAGRVWFGFQDGRLLTITEGRVHLYSSQDGLPPGEVKAIGSAGTHVWVGGEAGLVLLRGSRFTQVVPDDSPAFGSVSGIVASDDGSLWLNENRGVIRISAPQVAAILQDSSHRTDYELFSTLDGLSGATEQVTKPTAVRAADGRLWFTTTNGAAWVDPRHLHRNELPPPVVIQSIVADGQTLSASSGLELPGKTTQLQIAYAGLSFSVPERVQFRYRLKGLDHEWQSAGTRRTAYYTRIPPGSYDFQVIAANDGGVWNEIGAHLPIRIVPVWYQTRWFYALCALLVVAALAALYRLRLAQVRADTRRLLEVRISERERIARELHDTLLQGFQGLMLRLQAVRNLLPERPGDAAKSLDSAMQVGDQAIGEGRDAVQSLHSSSVDDRDLATSLSALATELAAGIDARSKPQYRVIVEGRPRELTAVVRVDAYRIAREAVRNAYEHAKAGHIETEVTFGDVDLTIRVRDDGIGVDPQILASGQRAGHWGLPGMRERSESFGGRLHIWSERNAGTEVELRIPAKVAYAQAPPSTSSRLGDLFSWLR
jgi:signal transduction histidine kinase/streptogramin lyase